MKKYLIVLIDIITVSPSYVKVDRTTSEKVMMALEVGYEIYSAIPFSARDAAGIQYILRKEIKDGTT